MIVIKVVYALFGKERKEVPVCGNLHTVCDQMEK